MKLEAAKLVFPDAWLRRGKVYLHGTTLDRILDGIALSYTRRRYGGTGGTTYTWVEAWIGDAWISLGDPWPCLNPSTKSLREEINKRRPQTVYCPVCNDTLADRNDPTGQADCGSCGGSFAWQQRQEFFAQKGTVRS
jgi:ribosomal protein L37AE/L43A